METTLEQGPEVLDAVRVDLAPDVLLGVVNGLVREVGPEAAVGPESVGIDGCTGSDMRADMLVQSDTRPVGDDFGSNLSATVQRAHDDGFVHPASAVNLAGTLGLVHVAGLATDEGLLDFDGPLELVKAAGLMARRMQWSMNQADDVTVGESSISAP